MAPDWTNHKLPPIATRNTTMHEESLSFLYSHEDRSSSRNHRWRPSSSSTPVHVHAPMTSNRPEEDLCDVIDGTSANQQSTTCWHTVVTIIPARRETRKANDSCVQPTVDERHVPTPKRQKSVSFMEPTHTRSGQIVQAPIRLDLWGLVDLSDVLLHFDYIDKQC